MTAAHYRALVGLFLVFSTTGLVLPTTPLRAEEPAELEQLVVSALLEPVSAAQVAGSITVITREEIERRQVRYLGELLRDVPGFAVSQAGGPGAQTQVRVRGAEANHLLILVDGVRANDPASGDEFRFEFASTANIERIEIIRGPQSAIWGTDALAGVINIIRRPAAQQDYLSAEAEYGSFDSLNVGVNGGLQRGGLELGGGIAYLESGGTPTVRGGIENDASDNLDLNLAVSWQASDNWRWLLNAQHVDSMIEFDDFDFFTTGLPTDADRSTQSEQNFFSAETRWSPAGSAFSGSAWLGWQDSDNENFAEGSFDSSTAAETLEFRMRGSVLLDGPESGNYRLTLAFDHDDTDFTQRGIASPFGDPNQDQSYSVNGYAAELLGRSTDRLHWNLNARHDDFSEFDDATTWQAAGSFRISPGLRLRGSVGTGSKAPTFTERFGFYPDFFVGNPDLKPETSEGWELGLELEATSSLQLAAVYFHQDLEDEIDGFVFDPETFFFTARNREGTSTRSGVELTADLEATEQLSFDASYTYVDAREATASGASQREARRPRHLASLAANYRFGGERGNLNLSVNYNGDQLDSYFPPPFFLPVVETLGGFTVVDLAASWKLTGQLELTGRVSNLLDEEYEEILGFVRPGRGIFVGVRGHFGSR